MSILIQYWIKEFCRFFLIIHTIVLSIFIAVDYLTNIDKFLKSGISLFDGFGYVLLKLPFMFVQLTPAVTVLSAVTVFGLMNRNNELLAIRSGGVSTAYIVMPAIITGLALSLIMFSLSETLVTFTMSKANHIKYSVIKKNRNLHAVRENIWIKGDGYISHFKYFNPVDRTIAGVTITFLDRDFKMLKRVDAQTGEFKENRWILKGVLEQIFDKNIQDFAIKEYEEMEFDLNLAPDDLKAVVKKAEEMDFFELAAHIKKVEAEGYDATTYKVDLFGKSAFPFICVIMAIIGAATGMRRFVKSNLSFGIVVGGGVSFFYWIVHGFSTSLGYARILPPFVSAWAANLIFLSVAIIYLINTQE
ncbi:MAG: LPS export ABC transporter permease LptG [Desulfamplus sp.]|nr:LPS export ABC transporter permease LptG [Desulfamplus sp.]